MLDNSDDGRVHKDVAIENCINKMTRALEAKPLS